MKKILVPTDFSDCAWEASQTAIEIAKVSNSDLNFLHIMSIPIDWVHLEANADKMYPDITKRVSGVTEELRKHVREAEKEGVNANYFIGYSDDKRTIQQHIQEHNVDMVVMGSHGASGMKELFIGSNAQKVIRYSDVPVLIVKEHIDSILVPNVVFVSDFEGEAMTPFNKVVGLAEMLGANIHLLYVNTPAFFNDTKSIEIKMESFRALASDRLAKAEIYCDFIFEEGIQKYCDEIEFSVIAIATHGRRGFTRMLLGNDAEKVVNHVKNPVLSLHF